MYFTAHPESRSNEYRLYIFLFKFPYLESNNFPFWYLSHVITLRQFDSRQPSHSQYNIYEVPGNRYKSSLSEILFYYFIFSKEKFSVILVKLWICAHLIVIVQYMSLGPCIRVISWSWNSMATQLFQEQERGVPSDLYRKCRTWNLNTMLKRRKMSTTANTKFAGWWQSMLQHGSGHFRCPHEELEEDNNL